MTASRRVRLHRAVAIPSRLDYSGAADAQAASDIVRLKEPRQRC